MKLPIRVYLASPFSHPEERVQERREQKINAICAHLYLKHKVAIIPPIMISAIIKRELQNQIGTTFKEWEAVDLAYISGCKEVWVACMDGWDRSIGVQAEIKFARSKNLVVRFIDPITLEFVKEPNKEEL